MSAALTISDIFSLQPGENDVEADRIVRPLANTQQPGFVIHALHGVLCRSLP